MNFFVFIADNKSNVLNFISLLVTDIQNIR